MNEYDIYCKKHNHTTKVLSENGGDLFCELCYKEHFEMRTLFNITKILDPKNRGKYVFKNGKIQKA